MPCFKPLDAWKTPNGQIIFYDSPGLKKLQVPCGRCIGCRMTKAKEWSIRCMHEASMHQQNCFITLTYNAENLPPDCGLRKRDVQKFFKRLRKEIAPTKIRYYYCGEYGEENSRPHYHIILFGYDFKDRIYVGESAKGNPIYMSPTLERIWGNGFVQVGDVTKESTEYTARYIMKKQMGKSKDIVDEKTGLKPYERINSFTGEIHEVLPEYNDMSRGGRSGHGIGHGWFTRYAGDLYPKDYFTNNGTKHKPPRYYDEQLRRNDPDLHDSIKAQREYQAYLSEDNTPERLQVREKVTKARVSKQTRS